MQILSVKVCFLFHNNVIRLFTVIHDGTFLTEKISIVNNGEQSRFLNGSPIIFFVLVRKDSL